MDESMVDAGAGQEEERKFGCLQVFAIVLLTVLVTAGVTLWIARIYIFPSQFEPVVLTAQEEQQLSVKLNSVGILQKTELARKRSVEKEARVEVEKKEDGLDQNLEPEAYTEEGASRDIIFTERELNAMIARNTDLATKVAVDLGNELISARLRIPVDQDFPIFGGKTLRAAAGLELAYREGQPVVVLRGVKLMGVPIPNAWLGGLKNIDLVREFGGDTGFWKTFSDGVESIEAQEGQLKISLKE